METSCPQQKATSGVFRSLLMWKCCLVLIKLLLLQHPHQSFQQQLLFTILGSFIFLVLCGSSEQLGGATSRFRYNLKITHTYHLFIEKEADKNWDWLKTLWMSEISELRWCNCCERLCGVDSFIYMKMISLLCLLLENMNGCCTVTSGSAAKIGQIA